MPAPQIDRREVEAHVAGDDPRHVEPIVDQPGLRDGIALDDLDRVLVPRRGDVAGHPSSRSPRGPHKRNMGCGECNSMPTVVRRQLGHVSTGPSWVRAQSIARTVSPARPPPERNQRSRDVEGALPGDELAIMDRLGRTSRGGRRASRGGSASRTSAAAWSVRLTDSVMCTWSAWR